MILGFTDIIVIIYIFQLFIFSFFLFHKARKKISSIILAFFFIAQAIGSFNQIANSQFDYLFNNIPFLIYIGPPFYLLWAPLLYVYVKSYVYSDFSFKWQELIHFVPALIVGVYYIFSYYLKNFETKQLLILEDAIINQEQWKIYNIILYSQVMIYNIFSLRILHNYKRKIKDSYSSTEKMNIAWLKFILYGYIIACLINDIIFFLEETVRHQLFDYGFLMYFAFFIFFNLLFYKALVKPDIFITIPKNLKYKKSSLTKKSAADLLNTIDEFMISNKPYLQPAITIKELSVKINVPDRHLSQVINEYKKQNFYDFVNSYRINMVKEIFADPEQKNKTILEILYETGFNSKASFNLAFKKHTGMTPTKFKHSVI